MTEYAANVTWTRRGAAFADNRYSRAHRWRFDGGAEVEASASPHVVPVPLSDPAAVDPEEAFVAALASCHMLFFLSTAARRGFEVEQYSDDAVGRMGVDEEGRQMIIEVILQPAVEYGARAASRSTEIEMHHEAHERCFLANSVRTRIVIDPSEKGS